MSETGRFYIRSKSGKLYCIEPVQKGGKTDGDWGNQIPGGGVEKVKSKYPGAVKPKESIITEENGFVNIVELEPGVSPIEYIERLEQKDELKRNQDDKD